MLNYNREGRSRIDLFVVAQDAANYLIQAGFPPEHMHGDLEDWISATILLSIEDRTGEPTSGEMGRWLDGFRTRLQLVEA